MYFVLLVCLYENSILVTGDLGILDTGIGNGRELPDERLCTPSAFKPVTDQRQVMINQLGENLLPCVASTESSTVPTNFHVLNSGWTDGKNLIIVLVTFK